MKNKTKQSLINLLANNKISIIVEDASTEPLEINSSISNIEIDNIASNYVIDNYIYHLSVGEDVYCFDFNSRQEIESEDFIVIGEYEDPDSYDLTEEEFNYYQQLTAIARKLGFEKKHGIQENIIKRHKIKNFLEDLEKDNNLDFTFSNIDIETIDLEDPFYSIKELLDESGQFNIEMNYYSDAIQYLKDNDPSFSLSLQLAEEIGCSITDINSQLLASLLASDEVRQQYNNLKNEIEEFFNNL